MSAYPPLRRQMRKLAPGTHGISNAVFDTA
ncbi:NRDE family protein [Paraburkholderia antibiotica]|uniref:NRDE family protein n=1 Tax=Paraburkholderia antibiotica TaxID=2728839 RepID=A0A7X9ZWK4_9BURK|nr:NRDE family protein [Paraburkholderia antibiotica]NML31269.1 NRDE family protein [Paraburkholderia antibiotica]